MNVRTMTINNNREEAGERVRKFSGKNNFLLFNNVFQACFYGRKSQWNENADVNNLLCPELSE